MKIFYSRSTLVSYLEGIHTAIPKDAVHISQDRYDQVIGSPGAGKIRSHNDDGLPILIDAPPRNEVSLERAWRDSQIASVQWLRDRHRDEQDMGHDFTLTQEESQQLLDYMQQLRDWPASPNFPAAHSRPSPPDWVASLTQQLPPLL